MSVNGIYICVPQFRYRTFTVSVKTHSFIKTDTLIGDHPLVTEIKVSFKSISGYERIYIAHHRPFLYICTSFFLIYIRSATGKKIMQQIEIINRHWRKMRLLHLFIMRTYLKHSCFVTCW